MKTHSYIHLASLPTTNYQFNDYLLFLFFACMRLSAFLFLLLLVGCDFEPEGINLDVATWNIRYDNPSDPYRWEDRKKWVAYDLEKFPVVGLQEVLPHQLEDLNELMPDHEFVGAGRDNGINEGEICAIGYDTRRITLSGWQTHWLSETPLDTGTVGWNAALPRVFTYASILDSSQVIHVINTHFDHLGEEARIESANQIVAFCERFPVEEPVLVMGDLNAELNSKPYNILQESRLGDTYYRNTPRTTFTGFRGEHDKCIDYIFQDGFWVVKAGVSASQSDSLYISDHSLVYTTVKH